jgi:hypothetical protein
MHTPIRKPRRWKRIAGPPRVEVPHPDQHPDPFVQHVINHLLDDYAKSPWPPWPPYMLVVAYDLCAQQVAAHVAALLEDMAQAKGATILLAVAPGRDYAIGIIPADRIAQLATTYRLTDAMRAEFATTPTDPNHLRMLCVGDHGATVCVLDPAAWQRIPEPAPTVH